ncbi:complex I NDUFA9 subunit family protein [Xinfangfangia sp. D13-10-4-6]|uniref:complex I NDUFA9 subunit family protein n=1 Tax=Pseudogemmobacter hezensis TaxID=2737662 RepID=UPI0015543829|nr:complex I NDUFA9 subunit family protein [Pseudogemmobacter hezensis]NPD14405.1 complex I NDUFA9 subunit family protein [Pseudogemmobacter hezensis]
MSKLVTIYGGSGFVGRYIARRFARLGWRVRVAVRRPNEALFVKPYGAPGQVEPILCNIRNLASVKRAAMGADAVINCVGTFRRGGKNNFDAVHVAGAANIAQAAKEAGVAKLIHLSAIGADAASASLYGKSKAAGEAAVLAAFEDAIILRPSVIFGTEDQFFNKFAAMAQFAPLLPIAGGATRFQPVFVDDVAQAAVQAITNPAAPGVYELGGPEAAPLSELLNRMLPVIQRRRIVLNLPVGLMALPAFGFDLVETLTGGLIVNKIVTRDHLKMLAADNVVAEGARGFADLGVTPLAFEAVIADYLWRFRPSGQFAAIKDSAKNLKKV